ncbi:hypothetical protein KNV35_gp55 [uncultured phage cr8_1]|uniref:Uncharacterized protein n=1 Tax=uncultured phage cr8_1 TaxID=2772068 RepID=A0A7M1S0S7_9CAUD|nr:hypothetical protein KNV35_gp55 [uncultured phage cr8_1]QOR58880.1 hypothetical protein [uncultured phage cr8_1]
MKIKFNNNKVMQRMIEFKVKVKEVPKCKVTAEYEIFKGQPNYYYNPLVAFNIKDNTAKKILEYVAATLGTNQTSVELESKGLAKVLGLKDIRVVRNSIKVLIDNNCMYRWQDIIDVDNVIKPNRNWYLLNPLVVRNINIENWNKQVDVTCREFNNTKGAKISEFSALEFEDFLKIPQTIDKRNTDDKNRKVISVKDYSRRGVKS